MLKTKLHFQRFEMKYQIPLNVVQGLLPELLKYMEFDPYAKNLPEHAYTIASLYYDSAGLGCYYQKLAGNKTRKKLRVRFYPDADNFQIQPETPIFLEIKKKYDKVVVKDRLALDYEKCYKLLKYNQTSGLNLTPGEQRSLNEFLWLKLYNGLLPQNMVIYKRQALISKVDPNFRVTIDYDLQTFLSNWLKLKDNEKKVSTDLAILEVKFNNLMPAWFQNIIQRYGLEQQPFSKYCTCLETCKPELVGKKFTEIYAPQFNLINN